MATDGAWLLETLPKWARTLAVALGLASMGATGGNLLSNIFVNKELIAEVQLLRKDVQKQTCLQVSQLRRTDWTVCIINPSDGTIAR